MNRTIKFRGKRIDNGQWVYGDLVQCDHDILILPINTGWTHHKVIPETVGQFTGLLDKNGREIYEGDIIESKYSNPAPVEFLDGQFCANYNGYCALIPSEAYVVIGNVHDTPELFNTK